MPEVTRILAQVSIPVNAIKATRERPMASMGRFSLGGGVIVTVTRILERGRMSNQDPVSFRAEDSPHGCRNAARRQAWNLTVDALRRAPRPSVSERLDDVEITACRTMRIDSRAAAHTRETLRQQRCPVLR